MGVCCSKMGENSMNELIRWFQNNFPELVRDMQNCTHHYVDPESGEIHLNPFHLEGDVWTHVNMVMMQARDRGEIEAVKLAALGHDLGKPMATYQNHEKKRVRMSGHEGASVYLMEGVLRKLDIPADEQYLAEFDKRYILEIVNWHQNLFKEVVQDEQGTRMSKSAIHDYGMQPLNQIRSLLDLMTCDGNGRWGDPPYQYDYAKSFWHQFEAAQDFLASKVRENTDGGQITLLIGPPCSGKSTWIKAGAEHLDSVIVSRDNVIMQLASGYMNYEQAWASVDQKKVDSELQKQFQLAKKSGNDIIVDMTNMSRKSRRKWLHGVPKNWNRKAVVFITPWDELLRRNANREGKILSVDVLKKMVLRFAAPLYSEFDEIEWVFN